MSIARAAAVGSLVVAIIAIGVLMFGGGGGTEYTVRMQTANQLVKGNQVKVGGLPVGEVTDIKLSEDNQADIKVTINDDFAPLRRGSSITVRQESLPSVANRYLSLHPGPNNGEEIPDGGTLDADETTNVVDLDQLFNTLDPKARKGLQGVLRGFGTWYVGQSDNLQDTFKYLAPSLGNLSKVMEELGRDQKTFESLIVNSAKALGAIASRRDDLAELVTNGTGFARALGNENAALDQTLAALPDVLEEGSVTFENLRSALVPLNELTDVSKPQIKGLAPFLQRFAHLFGTMRPTFGNLSRLGQRAGAPERLGRPDANITGSRADLAPEFEELRQGAQERPGRGRVPAALRPRHLGLDHALLAGPRLLRRERSLRARAADLQRVPLRRGDERADRAGSGRACVSREQRRHAVLPRRCHAAGPRRLQPVDRRRQARSRGLQPQR